MANMKAIERSFPFNKSLICVAGERASTFVKNKIARGVGAWGSSTATAAVTRRSLPCSPSRPGKQTKHLLSSGFVTISLFLLEFSVSVLMTTEGEQNQERLTAI